VDPVAAESLRTIREGSKSFAGAARLLSPGTRESVYRLYAWCRYCDDQVDLQDLGRGAPAEPGAAGAERLDALFRETRCALAGEAVTEVPFLALQQVAERHDIPHRHPLELLEGFAMDVEGRRYRTLEETLTYCYHVAGVVGVMMAHVMGAEGKDTLDRASDLGLALQMTNIARDVTDDASGGRIYLPLDWLAEEGIEADRIAEAARRPAVARVVTRFLAEADRYYRSAGTGIARLPLRSAWAVAAARDVYRQIGREVLRRGERAWDKRTFVGRPRKLLLVAGAGLETLLGAVVGSGARPVSREGLWTRP
jgi:phytoene synthase